MERIIDILIKCYEYDVSVFSEPWMYIPFLIPIMFYLVFFFLKWIVLTAPLWLPFAMILKVVKSEK